MKNNNKIILITRSYNNPDIIDFVKGFCEIKHNKEKINVIEKIIVLVDLEKEQNHYTQTLLRKFNDDVFNKLEIIYVKPWGIASGALNIGLQMAFKHKPDYIMIASPEVKLNKEHVKKMSDVLNDNPEMLVVGYAIKINIDGLSDLERGHYFGDNNSISDTLKFPWNTCAMWNTEKFVQYVGAFNILCDCPKYICHLTNKKEEKLHGMEDALAIALAKKRGYNFEIGIIKEGLQLNIKNINLHKEKIDRKRRVYEAYDKIFNGLPKIKTKQYVKKDDLILLKFDHRKKCIKFNHN